MIRHLSRRIGLVCEDSARAATPPNCDPLRGQFALRGNGICPLCPQPRVPAHGKTLRAFLAHNPRL